MDMRSHRIFESENPYWRLRRNSNVRKMQPKAEYGVLGLAANIPICRQYTYFDSFFQPKCTTAERQGRRNSHGRLDPAQAEVDAETLVRITYLQVALLIRRPVPKLNRVFDHAELQHYQILELPHLEDYQKVEALDVRPPDVWRYFVRVKPEALAGFAQSSGLSTLEPREIEDEFVYQNSYKLNPKFMPTGRKRAFVLCHGRNFSGAQDRWICGTSGGLLQT